MVCMCVGGGGGEEEVFDCAPPPILARREVRQAKGKRERAPRPRRVFGLYYFNTLGLLAGPVMIMLEIDYSSKESAPTRRVATPKKQGLWRGEKKIIKKYVIKKCVYIYFYMYMLMVVCAFACLFFPG